MRHLEPRKPQYRKNRIHADQTRSSKHLIAIVDRNPNAAFSGVRQWRAHKGDFLHVREVNISDILSAATQKAIVLLPQQRGPDAWLQTSLVLLTVHGPHA